MEPYARGAELMDATQGSFRDRVLAGEPLVGTFLNLGSAMTAEIAGLAGFDWVLIDLEHGSGTEASLIPQIHAVAPSGTAIVVRVEQAARTNCSRALDPGANGVMFPRIEGAEEAARVVGYLRYPPRGVRGVAVQNRSGRFGQVRMQDLGESEREIVGVVQVETRAILEELHAVAAVDGVDVLFVGPGDLSYALGVPGRLDDPNYEAAIDGVIAAAARHGKSAGVLVRDAAEAELALERGFRTVAVGSDSALLMSGASSTVRAFRAAAKRHGVMLGDPALVG